jgi:acylphosphatase
VNDTVEEIRIHARVTGLVQGVGYRYFAFNAARRLSLTGWVRNCADGSVEAEAQGGRTNIAQFLSQLKLGPRWAQVSNVEARPITLCHGADAKEFRVESGY